MSNPTTNIVVMDMPLRIRACFPTLISGDDDEAIQEGFVVTEVGKPATVKLRCYDKPFGSYHLRAPRTNQMPTHIFGKCLLNDAYSAFLPRVYKAPAVGSTITIDPVVTAGQLSIIKMYNYISADVHYIMHVPSPLGVGIYLHVFAPELDDTTVTRGVRFKPSSVNTIAFSLPWSNDLMMVPNTKPRFGQCGGSLRLRTVEDNSISTVSTPLSITVFCCVTNIKLAGFNMRDTDGKTVGGLNFAPQPRMTPPAGYFIQQGALQAEEQSDVPTTEEISAEGGLLASNLLDINATPLTPEVETLDPVSNTMPDTAHSMGDTGQVVTKWVDYKTILLQSPASLDWTDIIIDPYADAILRQAGEAISLAWRRNVWTSGSLDAGYLRTLVVQINIPRPPQISGTVEFIDSYNSSSRYLVSFGSRVDIPLIPVDFNGLVTSFTKPRDYNNPWLKTNRATVALRYRLVAFNRSADIADISIKIMLRTGFSVFQVPRKPLRNYSQDLQPLLTLLRDKFRSKDEAIMASMRYQSIDTQRAREAEERKARDEQRRKDMKAKPIDAEQHADFNPSGPTEPSQFITPYIGESPEHFTLQQDIGQNEDLNLDSFPVLLFSGEIPLNKVFVIPLNLSTIEDKFNDLGSENPITQKFLRYANLIPTGHGAFGPVIGSYTIHLRLPTTVAGELLHNCIPGDMVEEVASRALGLQSLASLAGTALASVGGPLVNGLVNTAAPILSSAIHAIGGNAVGTIADNVINGVTGVVSSALKPTPAEQSIQGSKPGAISGDIPISRFVQMVKYVKDNYVKDQVFPHLLIQARNFYDFAADKKIPISVFANMRSVKVERSIFDRSVYPEVSQLTDAVFIPLEGLSFLLENFVVNKSSWQENTTQNKNFKKFVLHINEVLSDPTLVNENISLNDILDKDISTYETMDISQIISRTKLYRWSVNYIGYR
uniref:Uncharacterized protein n=1 Tax=Riboviria sp. TaxID=2585031 RepID=A0A8K1WQB5_9VIRU|nr:MAG: hypothetical protein 2 [Riboviria sp.]